MKLLPALAGAALALAGCSALVSADESDLGPRPRTCTPGTRRACPCLPVGSPPGTQLCTAEGGYDECHCAPQAGSGG